jgi:hypothetical protein
MMPLKSRLGGLASLQKAICLDSTGNNAEAFTLYKKLKSHTAPGVSKAARRMLFGFEAAEELKVDINRVERTDWGQYFDRINTGGWAMYKPPSQEAVEEDEGAATAATVVAASVVMLPLVTLAIYVVTK